MIARIDPINIRNVNFSFKKRAANKPVKIGVIAKMIADVVGSAVCNTSDLLTSLKFFLYTVIPTKHNTINESLSEVNRPGEKSSTKIFPNTKLLPHTTTQKVSQP
ncbi:hypothetical protein D3C78_1601130 [compost metagenome]